MSRLSEQVTSFVKALSKEEEEGLLFKYDLASLSEATKVIKRIEDVRIRQEEKVEERILDYFNPPDEMITCIQCGDEFGQDTTRERLRHHMLNRHPVMYANMEKKYE